MTSSFLEGKGRGCRGHIQAHSRELKRTQCGRRGACKKGRGTKVQGRGKVSKTVKLKKPWAKELTTGSTEMILRGTPQADSL